MPTQSVLTIANQPWLIASAYQRLVIVTNTGSAPLRVVTTGPDNGRVIAAGAKAELEMAGRWSNLLLACDTSTTVTVESFTLMQMYADAASAYRVPADFLSGLTKAEITASALHFAGTAA